MVVHTSTAAFLTLFPETPEEWRVRKREKWKFKFVRDHIESTGRLGTRAWEKGNRQEWNGSQWEGE